MNTPHSQAEKALRIAREVSALDRIIAGTQILRLSGNVSFSVAQCGVLLDMECTAARTQALLIEMIKATGHELRRTSPGVRSICRTTDGAHASLEFAGTVGEGALPDTKAPHQEDRQLTPQGMVSMPEEEFRRSHQIPVTDEGETRYKWP